MSEISFLETSFFEKIVIIDLEGSVHFFDYAGDNVQYLDSIKHHDEMVTDILAFNEFVVTTGLDGKVNVLKLGDCFC